MTEPLFVNLCSIFFNCQPIRSERIKTNPEMPFAERVQTRSFVEGNILLEFQ